jgi:hypothetical protein
VSRGGGPAPAPIATGTVVVTAALPLADGGPAAAASDPQSAKLVGRATTDLAVVVVCLAVAVAAEGPRGCAFRPWCSCCCCTGR